MESELLPCPICNGTDNETTRWDDVWSVVCADNYHHVEVTADTEAKAVSRWNTRAALAVRGEEPSLDDPFGEECHRCHATMGYAPGLEPTKYCNLCAHEVLEAIERELAATRAGKKG